MITYGDTRTPLGPPKLLGCSVLGKQLDLDVIDGAVVQGLIKIN